MRNPLLYCLFPVLGACSLMPRHDPAQAWVDLDDDTAGVVQATQVDSQPLEDDRYFQVTPGEHELQVRLQFDVDPANIGPDSAGLSRTCLLTLDYDGFDAGRRYRLDTGSAGFRPWAQLKDERGAPVARAREGRCGDV
ncbi:PA0061/PA0062 family lipoprotein [Pseudomonas mangiferae]|uniref:Lipoprotein n=1 Tax=Pseudomonas mangiferae TaxID=2593654 RepID=A0A553GWI9_9PSED|nr:hypothetical protein [Pseudomonas mangiferae]TRX73856.1 hypothetical protein FM069_15705 [Pseudomonas mangiferae]